MRCCRRGVRCMFSLVHYWISSRMFAYPLHTPTQRGHSLVIGHNSPCRSIVCRPHRLLALLHCAIHVYTHRFGFRGGSVLHLSLPIQVRIHPTHVATRATYAYALALFVLTRHSFTRKRTLSYGHKCPVVLFARVGQYVNGLPVWVLAPLFATCATLHVLRGCARSLPCLRYISAGVLVNVCVYQPQHVRKSKHFRGLFLQVCASFSQVRNRFCVRGCTLVRCCCFHLFLAKLQCVPNRPPLARACACLQSVTLAHICTELFEAVFVKREHVSRDKCSGCTVFPKFWKILTKQRFIYVHTLNVRCVCACLLCSVFRLNVFGVFFCHNLRQSLRRAVSVFKCVKILM